MLVFVARLEALSATKRDEIAGWVIMEALTGQRFTWRLLFVPASTRMPILRNNEEKK